MTYLLTEEAKRWYGIIGSGAVVGGIMGSALTALIVKEDGTVNLIYVCEGILVLLLVSSNVAQRLAKRSDARPVPAPMASRSVSRKPDLWAGFKLVASKPYLSLLLAFVLVTQVMSTVLDYQFNAIVQEAVSERRR